MDDFRSLELQNTMIYFEEVLKLDHEDHMVSFDVESLRKDLTNRLEQTTKYLLLSIKVHIFVEWFEEHATDNHVKKSKLIDALFVLDDYNSLAQSKRPEFG